MTTNTNSKLHVSSTTFKRGATIMMLMGGLLLSACGPVDPEIVTPTGTVTSINATASASTVKVGGTVTITPKVVVTGDFKTDVTYSSNDAKIATVDTKGVVTGVAVGSATITVKSVSDTTKVTTVKIDVTAAVVTATPAPAAIAKINFQPEKAGADGKPSASGTNVAVPAGFTGDFGAALAAGKGWKDATSMAPVDLTAAGVGAGRARQRTATTFNMNLSAVEAQNTLMQMQFTNAATPPVTSTYAYDYPVTEKGLYTVTVSVGDSQALTAGFAKDIHTVNIEGKPALVKFEPKAGNLFATITTQVDVQDGSVTIDALGGTGTKINYAIVSAAKNPSVRTVTPDDGDTGVVLKPAIVATFNLVGTTAIDLTSLTADTVQLFAVGSTTPVAGTIKTSATDVTFTPTDNLVANTVYTFKVNGGAAGARDKGATPAAFFNFVSTFTTAK